MATLLFLFCYLKRVVSMAVAELDATSVTISEFGLH